VDTQALAERVAAEPDPAKKLAILKEPRKVSNVTRDPI
jgi:hypothetical protein